MASGVAIVLEITTPDPHDQVRLGCRVVASGGPTDAGYTFDAYVDFDASSDDINAAIIAGAVTAAAGHSVILDSVRILGGAMAKVS